MHPALARLLILKLRGRARIALRRLRTPGGFVFGCLGVALLSLWLAGLGLRLRSGDPDASPHVVAVARVAVLAYAIFAVTANLSWRGLYLPRAEIERLFAAPITRRELVRYRLAGILAPTTFVALLAGAVAASRVPVASAGFLGGVLVVATTAVVGQGAAILAAHDSGRLSRVLDKLPGGLPRIVGALGLGAVLLLVLFSEELAPPRDGVELRRGGAIHELDPYGAGDRPGDAPSFADSLGGRIATAVEHPAVRALTAPFHPYAAAIGAPTFRAAAPWLALCVLLFVLAFEAVARLPVDFREASLSTSRDVEKRLARLRRGQLGAAGADAARMRGWRVPWVFGTSPFAAVLWLKTATLLRQGRGALATATLMTSFGVAVGVYLLPDPHVGTIVMAVIGVLYVASGLRFDFRSELDRMEVLRAWPLAAWQVFLAVILPVTMFVSFFVALLLVLRGVLLGDLGQEVLAIVAAVPLGALLWIALDNAVFLVLPVRFVPGQGGALQHSGRAVVMVALRLGLLAGVGTVASLASYLGALAGEALGLGPAVVAGLAASSALMVLLATAVVLIGLGGYALTRYDVARARQAAG